MHSLDSERTVDVYGDCFFRKILMHPSSYSFLTFASSKFFIDDERKGY